MKELIMQGEDERRIADQYKEQVRILVPCSFRHSCPYLLLLAAERNFHSHMFVLLGYNRSTS